MLVVRGMISVGVIFLYGIHGHLVEPQMKSACLQARSMGSNSFLLFVLGCHDVPRP